jgi:YD repeat-containing protein
MSARRPKVFRLLLAAAFALAAAVTSANAAETYTYDPVGRLSDVSYANGGSLHYTYDGNGNILSIVTSLASGVEGVAPLQFALGPTTPNPGASARNIVFSTPSRARVSLRVYDVAGRLVATLVDRDLDAGRHNVRFFSDRWAAGVYFYRLESAGKTREGRMVVLR